MFQEALTVILGKLEQAKEAGLFESFALIGGLAVATWGVPRATQDIDFAIALSGSHPKELSVSLGGIYEASGGDDPLQGVIRSTVVVNDQAIPIQCVVFPEIWTPILFSSLETISIEGVNVPVVSWLSLVLLKLYAGGPQDMLDAQNILAVHTPSQKDLETLVKKSDYLGLSEELNSVLPL